MSKFQHPFWSAALPTTQGNSVAERFVPTRRGCRSLPLAATQ
jgi:hypothetical protein